MDKTEGMGADAMFGDKRDAAGTSEQVETLIGQGTQFKGTITVKGAIRIDGEFEGDLMMAGKVIIGKNGKARSVIKAKEATIAGLVSGNVEIAEKLELLPTARLTGDVKAGTIIIGEGAIFKGACEMKHESGNHEKEAKPKS
ncbi:polymer-forming cytoskeletal [Lucifera butyrica]|uniref:Polymer-forming cytoskeletal n=1 Tax=Lucifera butyrica TaxID=1351585 RepID=A0A498R989_9FIRM|nr:polymer-forming cytoskeletal protein [Lucifera butyrica]VBB07500.1 polymer-forming cytoskeletal [Lucifera butyrica]